MKPREPNIFALKAPQSCFCKVQDHRRLKPVVSLGRVTILLVTSLFLVVTAVDIPAEIFEGAAVGGFMGLVLGDDVDDVVDGAVVGGVAGGVAGLSQKRANETQARKIREQQQYQKEQEQQQAAAQQNAEARQAVDAQQKQEQLLIKAIGEDNYRGLLALINCEHERAEALSGAGKASITADHQLASLWLKALIANDLRKANQAKMLYQQLITDDPDIDTEQQASLETDKVLMEVRQERRDKEISCQL